MHVTSACRRLMQEALGSGLDCIVRPCLMDYKRFSFPVALPEQGCLAAAETVTSMCVVKRNGIPMGKALRVGDIPQVRVRGRRHQ